MNMPALTLIDGGFRLLTPDGLAPHCKRAIDKRANEIYAMLKPDLDFYMIPTGVGSEEHNQ